jgi:hypothetical protein
MTDGVADNPPERSAAGLAPPPFKDPRPSVERISQLANRVLTGDILLPKFQRDFVWPRPKILGLLDSIARNYPIGSILLWQSRQPLASERTIAGLNIADSRPDYPVNYLLDGQQRLSTVCGALYWRPNGDPNSLWNLVYDLRSEGFSHHHGLEEPPLTAVPLRYLSEPANYFRRTAALDDADLRARADRLFNRFQDYMIAAVTLGDMPIKDIAPIFERINSTATPLTIVDLMRAATWDPEFDLRDAIDGLLDALRARDFGSVERKTILRAVAAAAGYGFAVDDIDRLRNKSVAELRTVLGDVTEASKRAVDFLTSHIKAPRPQALPYANQFAVLTELFRRLPTPSGEQFRAIERWFWRTTLSGYFGGWNTGQMANDLVAVGDFAAGLADHIYVAAPLPRAEVWRLSQFRSNSAVSKMLALMLAYQNPVDLLTNQAIDARKSLAWSNDKEYHHLFPKAYLRERGVRGGTANAVANIVMLTSASNLKILDTSPAIYLRNLIDSVGEDEVVRRLERSLVPRDAMSAALANDYASFLQLRSERLHEVALEHVGEKEASDAPAVLDDEVLVDDDDEVADEPPG